MSDTKTRAKIHELHACAVGWAAKADRAYADGHNMDAVQHLRRAKETALAAAKLEETLNAD